MEWHGNVQSWGSVLNLRLPSDLVPVVTSALTIYGPPLWEDQMPKQKWVPGCGRCEDWLDLSLGETWLLVVVIILQGSCCFTVLAHFLTAMLLVGQTQQGCGLQRPLLRHLPGGILGPVCLTGKAGYLPWFSDSLSASSAPPSLPRLSITSPSFLAASHINLQASSVPFPTLFLQTSVFSKLSPTLVSKWLYLVFIFF